MNDEEEQESAEPGRKHTRKEAEAVDLDAGEDLTPEGEEEEAATARDRADAIGGIPEEDLVEKEDREERESSVRSHTSPPARRRAPRRPRRKTGRRTSPH